jgi:hypothetical protein
LFSKKKVFFFSEFLNYSSNKLYLRAGLFFETSRLKTYKKSKICFSRSKKNLINTSLNLVFPFSKKFRTNLIYTEKNLPLSLDVDTFVPTSNTNLALTVNAKNIPLIATVSMAIANFEFFPSWTSTKTYHQLPLYGIITGPSSNTIYYSSNSYYNWTFNTSTRALCQTFTLTGKNVTSDISFNKNQDPAGF